MLQSRIPSTGVNYGGHRILTDLRSACQGLKRMAARLILSTRLRPFFGLQSSYLPVLAFWQGPFLTWEPLPGCPAFLTRLPFVLTHALDNAPAKRGHFCGGLRHLRGLFGQ